jgi:hypothetical protein
MLAHKIELRLTTAYGFKLGNFHMYHFHLGTADEFNNKHFTWNTTKIVISKYIFDVGDVGLGKRSYLPMAETKSSL